MPQTRISINDAATYALLMKLAKQDVTSRRRSKLNRTATLYEILAAEDARRNGAVGMMTLIERKATK
jgi:hypothetical protein